ncbi:hypothetical protein [Candidatus Clostridium radicumherbarum]|uniref:Uncharacterized protein n=1 Tax=Candidatus Clostridium radicumherbarum TaxID=3381662 RepID=A0ABW8TXH4_9CLOT
MTTFIKKIIVIGIIITGWIILMFMMVEQELGQFLFRFDNTRISLFLQHPVEQIKTSNNLQIIIFVLAIILIEEIILKISSLRKF